MHRMKPILKKKTTQTRRGIKKKITIQDPKSSSPVRKRKTPKSKILDPSLIKSQKKKKLRFSKAFKMIPKIKKLLTEIEGSIKKKSKKKGILKIKIETYIKSNPLFKSKDIQTVLKHCRREIGFILTKLKAHLKYNNEKTLNMMGDYELKEKKVVKLFKIWKKYIFSYYTEKQRRDFEDFFGEKNTSREDDTFTWTTFLEENQEEDIIVKSKKLKKNEGNNSQFIDVMSENSSSSTSTISRNSVEDFNKIKIGFVLNEFFIFLLDFMQVRAGINLLERNLFRFRVTSELCYDMSLRLKESHNIDILRLRIKCSLLYAKSLVIDKRYEFAIAVYLKSLELTQVTISTIQNMRFDAKTHNPDYKIIDAVEIIFFIVK